MLSFCELVDERLCWSSNNKTCMYSYKAPRRGASNEYPQHMYSGRNKSESVFWLKMCTLDYVFIMR